MEVNVMWARILLSAFLFLLIGLFATRSAFAQPTDQNPATQPSHAGPTAWMQQAKTSQDLAQMFKQRFEGAADDQLKKYRSGDDAGDAIAAGWETVCRSLPPAKTYPDFVQPSDRAVAQFLDIVAARAGKWKESYP
jgi:hypothetical protein